MQFDVLPLRNQEVGATLEFSFTPEAPKLDDLPGLRNLAATGQVTLLDDHLEVSGTVGAEVPLNCGRCLVDYFHPLHATYHEEYSEHPRDEQFAYRRDTLDLEPMLRTLLLLTVPVKPLHDSGCRGLCPVCGKDLNREPHQHPADHAENPFASLKNLRN